MRGLNKKKAYKGTKGKTVDTDAWIEGVMQRSQTKELKAHLRDEVDKEETKLKVIRSELVELREKMFLTEDRIHSSKRQADKMGKSCEAFLREYRKFASVSAADLMHELNDQQGASTRSEDRKDREAKQRHYNKMRERQPRRPISASSRGKEERFRASYQGEEVRRY